ncbi:MAG: DUF448 domain-containing protein [Actinobacteria bacterium]|nr:DUF448 domain-containing protein [Actinomycetota bacterium]
MRLVAGPDAVVVVSPASAGRGAWLCRGSTSCFEEARRRKAFARALRVEVSEAGLDDLARLLGVASTATAKPEGIAPGPGVKVCEDGSSGHTGARSGDGLINGHS